MFDQIAKFIKKRVPIPEKDLEKAFSYSYPRNLKKGDYILRIGDYCRFIGFLNSGLIMNTIVDDGKEIACHFIFQDCFFTYVEGINDNIPSHRNFIAMEDCEMLMLDKARLPSIFAINQKFETLFTQILAEEVKNLLSNEESRRTKTAEQRYQQFMHTNPDAFNRIPLKHIAGFLGIEPESLSRLRKRLAGK